MANTYVTMTLKSGAFSDGSVLSGTYTAEYNASGSLIAIVNPNFVVTSIDGITTTFTSAKVDTTTGSFELTAATGNNALYSNLNIDWSGQTPTTLNSTSGTAATSVTNVFGTVLPLTSPGTITSMTDRSVTTTITGAAFADGATLSGTWTATYDPNGFLLAVQSATFTVTGPGGTNTFTSMGTLPYADDPTSSGFTSYEIHSLSQTGTGTYNSLYVDWKSENPSSFYEGSPSLFTSVKNTAVSSTAPIRLVGDGTSGAGSVPVISGLPSTETGTDASAIAVFTGVTVTDAGSSTASATIQLDGSNGIATDANGVLSGVGLTKTGTGTYSLAAASPASLTSELQALKLTPTLGQVLIGNTVSTQIDLAINDSDGSVSSSTALTVTATCFLPGTLIATPSGEVAVEQLRVGDVVSVLEHGQRVDRSVVWAGCGRMDAARFGGRDEAFPVRIRKDAFAAGTPARDLLVTPEHCILTEAGLVPARMLVNGASILIDRGLPEYEFFHIELNVHGILLAEGLAAESYLDTGNRRLFTDGSAHVGVQRLPTMAAPLAIGRELVEPIWTVLAERAALLGFKCPAAPPASIDQPSLQLLLEDGTALSCCWSNGRHFMFQIPSSVRPIRLLSHTIVPSQVVGPFVDDRRTLGVAVEKLVRWTGLDATVVLAIDLALDGWHELEGDRRWTNGNASLDLPETAEVTYLDVHLVGSALLPNLLAA